MKKTIFGILLFCLPIVVNAQLFTSEAFVDQHISCYGNNDGFIQIRNTPPDDLTYLYYAKNGRDTIINTRGEFLHLKPGTYKVWSTNGVGQKGPNFTLTVLSPKALTAKFVTYKRPTMDDPFGDLSVEITGGTANLQPYLVSWYYESTLINPVENMKLDMINLPAGKYMVVIEDDRGCFLNRSFLFRRNMQK